MGDFVWGSFADELGNITMKANAKAIENNERVDSLVTYFIKTRCRMVASNCGNSTSVSLSVIQENVDDWYAKAEGFDGTTVAIRKRVENLVIDRLGVKAKSTVHGDGIVVSWRKDDDNE